MPNQPIIYGENNVDAFLNMEDEYGLSASKSGYEPEPPVKLLLTKERTTGVPPTKSLGPLFLKEKKTGIPPTKSR